MKPGELREDRLVSVRRRWFRHPWLSVVIAVVWMLLQGSLAPAHLLWAAIMGIVLPWLLDPFLGPGSPMRGPLIGLKLLLVVLWDIVVANLAVARIVLHPGVTPQPAWVRVPYTITDARGVVLLATIITTTPGTVSCVIDEARSEILVHALNAGDPQAVADEIVERYERPLKEIFG
jgi:multicomponent K+:H+ antiporter subunit E